MTILICSDRDGTINLDDNYYLGSQENWQELVQFLPGVIKGIKLLNQIIETHFYILTNQPGVALATPNMSLLTRGRMNEVNRYIIEQLRLQGAHVDGYFACPFVDQAYIKRKEKPVYAEYFHPNHPDMKPNIGMIRKAAQDLKMKLEDIDFKFMIGDRASDIEMGLNASCISIYIASIKSKELNDTSKIKKMKKQYQKRVFIVNDFYHATKLIRNYVFFGSIPK